MQWISIDVTVTQQRHHVKDQDLLPPQGGLAAIMALSDDDWTSDCQGGLIPVPNALPYKMVRDLVTFRGVQFVLASGSDLPWPFAKIPLPAPADPIRVELRLTGVAARDPRTHETHIRLAPHLDDLCADVLDAISSLWLDQAGHPDHSVWVTAGDILARRGIRPRALGLGRRGGYDPEQIEAVRTRMEVLTQVWVHWMMPDPRRQLRAQGHTITVRDQLLVVSEVTASADPTFRGYGVRPGLGLAALLWHDPREARQPRAVDMVPQKILAYNPTREAPAKRLARYVRWTRRSMARKADGRIPATTPPLAKVFRVATLLNAVWPVPTNAPANGGPPRLQRPHPQRALQRLTAALAILKRDGIITDWTWVELGTTGSIRIAWRRGPSTGVWGFEAPNVGVRSSKCGGSKLHNGPRSHAPCGLAGPNSPDPS